MSINIETITISGSSPGASFSVPVFRIAGHDPDAAKVYVQAGLHADERPGSLVGHFLIEMLNQAAGEGLIAGDITIVPAANPIGLAQWSYENLQGRFDQISGENFNRGFERVELAAKDTLLENVDQLASATRLKRHLLHMALAADVVIDLHCDGESLLYAYICEEFWPAADTFAAALDLQAVLLADGQSSAFEEAVAFAWRQADGTSLADKFVTTLELRGKGDVSHALARIDADGLFDFFRHSGAINGKPKPVEKWSGPVALLTHIEMIDAPCSGTLSFAVQPGDRVAKGDLVVSVLHEPGNKSGMVEVCAPQDGLVLSRIAERYVCVGDNMLKLVCQHKSATARPPGALES